MLPAGPLGQALAALGRARAVSVALDDPALWRRPVPAIAGRMSVEAALARLAAASGTVPHRTGATSWRIGARPPRRMKVATPRPMVSRDDADGGEEVVVIASKRDTAARWFGGSAIRLDSDALSLGGPAGTDRIAARTTSLGSTHLGEGRNKLFIRGLADSSFTGPTQAIVGQYLGDLRLGYSGADPSLQLYDVRSVEILEGPQGTLYGSGALGGIIRMVPAAPEADAASGSATTGVSATAAGEPSGDIAGMLNLPVARDVALRVVGYAQRHGGYIDKPLLGQDDVNRVDIAGGRAALGWRIADGWSVELGGAAQRIRGRDSQYVDEAAPPLTNLRELREGYDTDLALGHLTVAGRIGQVSVRSSTGLVGQTVTERFDATQPIEGPTLLVQRQRTRLFTSEARAWRSSSDGSGWLVGASIVRHRRTLDRRFVPPLASFSPARSGESVAEHTLYGEGGVALLPWLVASGGLRWTDVALRDRGPTPAPGDADRHRREQVLLPSAALTARLGGLSLYARYQQGFRPGGLTVEADAVRRFRSDRLYAGEAGMRFGEEGGRWTARAAVSRSRWHGIQANFLDPYGLPSTANLGDGTIWSAEAAVGWRPSDEWHFDLAATVNWSRITTFSREARIAAAALPFTVTNRSLGMARIGGDVPNVADGTALAGMGWRRDMGDARLVTADLWLRYVGRSRLGVGPYLGEEQGGYVDSAATVRLSRGDRGVTLGIENLADTRGNRFALGTPFRLGLGQATPLRPRTIRLGLDASF